MSFWSWGESTAAADETQTASFWRWGETTAAPTQPYAAAAATAQDERRPTFWWSEPEAPASTATYTPGEDAGALAARARELGLEERAARRKSAPSRRDVDLALRAERAGDNGMPGDVGFEAGEGFGECLVDGLDGVRRATASAAASELAPFCTAICSGVCWC